MVWFRDKLNLLSQAKFYLWRLSKNKFEGRFSLKTGSTVFLRPAPFTDVGTATEIFATEIYEFPEQIKAENIDFIVDLGANVGYSCVHWLTEFPSANVIAFEPHPDHIKQVKRHLEANSGTAKVVLIPKAAGIEKGKLYLTDDEMSSTLTNTPAEGTMVVEVTDWIEELPNRTIDLLKMDIEGSEYVLLSDPRFSALDIRFCVIEWHNTVQHPNGRLWCEERVAQLGYNFCTWKGVNPTNGLLWAWRS